MKTVHSTTKARKPNDRRHGDARRRASAAAHSGTPHHHRKKRRGGSGLLPAAIIVALGALALTLLTVRLFALPARSIPAADGASARMDGDARPGSLPREAAFGPVVTFAPQATAAPTPEPTPEPTAAPTPEPTAFEYLPVVHGADIDSKKIAVTVDDCYQLNNLETIVSVSRDCGARLTLFPVGENIQKPGMAGLLKACAFDLGFEIENHTWSHARIFRLSDDEMAAEIWKQDAALDQALGADYQAHFLRLMGGDGDTDPRIHSYLKKLGYLGIANWSVSGSDSDMEHIKASLAPGQIYLFHCTDPDTRKLEEFIPWAVSNGYRLVTLNELFNLPANEASPLTGGAMVPPEYGVDDRHTLKEGEYTWVALQLQEKLRAMGYLVFDGPSTGYYGPQTVKAVAAWQKDNGLSPTGEADAETQRRLLGK